MSKRELHQRVLVVLSMRSSMHMTTCTLNSDEDTLDRSYNERYPICIFESFKSEILFVHIENFASSLQAIPKRR